jgi:hypothetical protein
VHKKNGKLRVCINFKKLNATTKKDPYPLPFIYEVLNTVIGYKAYSFLDGYPRYHQISIALEDKYKIAFVTPTYQKVVTKTFKEYLDNFMKIFLDDFIVYNNMDCHL